MNIGIVGYQSSGKSTLFQWLTGVASDPSLAHTSQSAMAVVPEERMKPLCEIYEPKKQTWASLELVDTPGLSRSHEGNAARLALIREAGCLALVVGAHDGRDAEAELSGFADDLLLADLEVVSRRVERLRELVKKPRPSREQDQADLEALAPLVETLEAGTPLTDVQLNERQIKATRSFQLLTEKPLLIVVNTAEDEEDPSRFQRLAEASRPVIAAPLRLQLELSEMPDDERQQWIDDMDVEAIDRGDVLRTMLAVSGQMLFFTAGDKEVRTWLIRRGATAVEAAEGIHTDLARGFIRAEVMTCDDLFRLGSEREVKAQQRMRQEHKDYVIQDGDIVHILHNA